MTLQEISRQAALKAEREWIARPPYAEDVLGNAIADAVTLAVLKYVAEYLARPKRIADHDNWPYDDLNALLASLVIPQEVNTSSERVSETAKTEHVDQPNGSVDGFGVNSTARKETT
jgi:hypothetical protein